MKCRIEKNTLNINAVFLQEKYYTKIHFQNYILQLFVVLETKHYVISKFYLLTIQLLILYHIGVLHPSKPNALGFYHCQSQLIQCNWNLFFQVFCRWGTHIVLYLFQL